MLGAEPTHVMLRSERPTTKLLQVSRLLGQYYRSSLLNIRLPLIRKTRGNRGTYVVWRAKIGVHSNQDLILCVKRRVYMGF